MAPAGLAGTQLVNGGFESGPGIGWEEYSLLGLPVIVDTKTLFDPGADIQVTPHTGDWAAWLGGQDNEISYIRQQVTIGSATPVLGYWHWIQSTDTCGFDLARILVDGVQVRSYSLCRNSNTGGWVKQTIDLSAYLGQTITLALQVTTDGSYVSSLYVDDVALAANPLPPLAISAAKNGTLVRLTWQHASPYTGYEVWRSTSAYFLPGAPGAQLRANVPLPGSGTQVRYDDAGAVGDATANYFYVVRGSGAGVTRSSNRTGEFDFALTPGN